MFNLEEKVHPQHTVLLVVDMQNDFCHAEGALAKNGVDVSSLKVMLPRLTALIEAARQASTKIIFIQTTHDKWTDSSARKARPLFQSMSVCHTETWGAEFYGVSPNSDELVITKHRYSAFVNTSLDLTLRVLGTQTLIVTGTATHVCVDCTARDGFQRDFHVIVPSDCSATSNSQLQESVLANLERYYGDVMKSDSIIKAWKMAE